MATKNSRAEAPGTKRDSGMQRNDNSEEARHLAEEALEERRQGNEEEARFVLEEARELDGKVVDDVLKEGAKNG